MRGTMNNFQQSRRSFFAGLGALIAAPAIVRAASLMPVAPRQIVRVRLPNDYTVLSGITRESVRFFMETNSFIANISRQHEEQFAASPAGIGAKLRIRLSNAA
jgi:hypothetical protein